MAVIEDAQTVSQAPVARLSFSDWLLLGLTTILAFAHGYAIWVALGGASGLTNGWPLWRDDHPLYFHSALVTRSFLRLSWTTAGYDPSFMSGYAKSVVFPASSTLPEVVIALFGGRSPALVYKLYVLVSVAAIPWLVAIAASLCRIGRGGILAAVALVLIYVWTDFPIRYARYGMVPYLLAIPLGLTATAAFNRYIENGRPLWWLASAALMTFVVFVHFTSAMIVAPTAAIVYSAAAFARRHEPGGFTMRKHLAVWSIPLIVLGLNAFWWLPGIGLASTKGVSDFAFSHSDEGVLARLLKIPRTEAPIQRVLWLTAALGLPALLRRGWPVAVGITAFVAQGFLWGYLAGGFPSLDFLQPGRHTFAVYSGLSIVAGLAIARGLTWLRQRFGLRMDIVAALAIVVFLNWYFGQSLRVSVRAATGGPIPFLSSQPSPRLLWVIKRATRYVSPGERLLYEEGGKDLPGIPDPFQGGRFSGLLSEKLGIELIGGPYLHAALTTNFTQFGEGKLFGRTNWDRDWFVRYAKLYRPSAILCWSPRARAFCRANPDLIEIKDDEGTLLIGRVLGFGGATIVGRAQVKAEPGRLRVSGAEGGLDGSIVLRYHSVPCLRTDPRVALDSVFLEEDPVPFIRLRPPPGTVAIELRFPP